MRHFSYFLFENFDADVHSHNPFNPRRFLNAETDEILSYIAGFPAGMYDLEACLSIFGGDALHTLMIGGIIKKEKDRILFDTPIFLREDAAAIRLQMDAIGRRLTDKLEKCLPQIRNICTAINNGFSVELNLYHILCGMVFDGFFFEYLDRNRAVAISRPHPSGLDYVSVIYERCTEWDVYSDGLLCSYNRFANSQCALQSFGDANGNRHDFYRFFRLLETGRLPQQYRTAQRLLNACGNINKDEILQQVFNFIKQGCCSSAVLALLEHFGYAQEGVIAVPIYTPEDSENIAEIARIVEEYMGTSFVAELTALSKEMNITANRHCVPSGEIANELYHILFGAVNEELVHRKIVAEPPCIGDEGRYFCSIQLQ